jgi:exodeoxyribonuclease VII small subunit
MASEEKEKSFEECLAALEQVVNQIEAGEMNLEESLSTFERGVQLVKTCNEKLSEVEKRIEVLAKDRNGKLQLSLLEDLEEDTSSDE